MEMRNDEISPRLKACISKLDECAEILESAGNLLNDDGYFRDLFHESACDAIVHIVIDEDKRGTYVKQLEQCIAQLLQTKEELSDLTRSVDLSSMVKRHFIPCPPHFAD